MHRAHHLLPVAAGGTCIVGSLARRARRAHDQPAETRKPSVNSVIGLEAGCIGGGGFVWSAGPGGSSSVGWLWCRLAFGGARKWASGDFDRGVDVAGGEEPGAAGFVAGKRPLLSCWTYQRSDFPSCGHRRIPDRSAREVRWEEVGPDRVRGCEGFQPWSDPALSYGSRSADSAKSTSRRRFDPNIPAIFRRLWGDEFFASASWQRITDMSRCPQVADGGASTASGGQHVGVR